jgi:hypothetical protein
LGDRSGRHHYNLAYLQALGLRFRTRPEAATILSSPTRRTDPVLEPCSAPSRLRRLVSLNGMFCTKWGAAGCLSLSSGGRRSPTMEDRPIWCRETSRGGAKEKARLVSGPVGSHL